MQYSKDVGKCAIKHTNTHTHTHTHTQCIYIPVLFNHFLRCVILSSHSCPVSFCAHRTGRHTREDSGSKRGVPGTLSGWCVQWKRMELHFGGTEKLTSVTFLSVLNVLSHQGCSFMSFMLNHCRNITVTCPSRSRLCRREALSRVGMCCSP